MAFARSYVGSDLKGSKGKTLLSGISRGNTLSSSHFFSYSLRDFFAHKALIHSNLRHVSGNMSSKSQAYVMQISEISQANIGISQAYLKHISGICQAMSGISQASSQKNLRHISSIHQAYIRLVSGTSDANLVKPPGKSQDIISIKCQKYI